MTGLRVPGSNHWLALGLGLACGLVLQIPHLLFGRVHDSMDWVFHYNLAREYAAALDAGDWRPRWAFGAQYGLGDPGPLYYAPLYYTAAAWLARLTGNVWLAMQGVEIAAAGMMGLAVFALAARYVSPRSALAAVPAALFSPMLILLHMGFNAYPWACALAPLALLYWALLRPDAENRVLNVPAILALAVTILTHVVTGLMAAIAVSALVIRPFLTRPDVQAVVSPLVTVLLGVMLSAGYLYPAYALQPLIYPEFLRGLHDPLTTFSLPVVTAWLFDVRALLVQWPVSLLLVAPACIALWSLRPLTGKPWLIAAALMVASATVLSSEVSAPLWLLETPLRNIQFPFRFMALLVPLVPVLIVVALSRGTGGRALLVTLTAAAMVLAFALIYKASVSDGRIVDTREAEFEPYRGLEEYRTRASLGLPQERFDWGLQCKRVGAKCGEPVRGPGSMTFPVTTDRPTHIVLPFYAFPAWAISINGVPAASRLDAETGLIAVEVPTGRNRITLSWKTMPAEIWGIVISLTTALLLILTALIPRARRGKPLSA